MEHWSRRSGVKSARWSWESETAVPKKRPLERASSRSLGISADFREEGRAEAASEAKESWTKSRRCMERRIDGSSRNVIRFNCKGTEAKKRILDFTRRTHRAQRTRR